MLLVDIGKGLGGRKVKEDVRNREIRVLVGNL